MPYIEFANSIDATKKIQEIQDRINTANEEYALYEKVIRVLKNCDGWTFTKRISTAIEKALPGYSARLDRIASLVNLEVWPSKSFNINRIRLFLGYESDQKINWQKCYDEHWVCWRNSKESALTYEKGLEKIPELVTRYNDLIKGLKELQKDAAKFGMDYDFDVLCVNRR